LAFTINLKKFLKCFCKIPRDELNDKLVDNSALAPTRPIYVDNLKQFHKYIDRESTNALVRMSLIMHRTMQCVTRIAWCDNYVPLSNINHL